MSSAAQHRDNPPHPYRADIDGLRAIAVLLVVGFHLYPKNYPGGFIGVDVFFVISGYLISGIIFRGLESGDFSFVEFYARRARRILPSLIVVLLFTYAAGWWILLADEYNHLSKHVASAALFVNNFTLWNEAGYFDFLAITKPLQHLWSLAIEEQFYILWPVTLVLAWRRYVAAAIILIGAASFAANIVMIDRDYVGAFYSPLCRFWELMIGALLGFWMARRIPTLSDKLSNVLGLAGLGIIFGAALFILDDRRPFPGWWALLPTVGTLCIIVAGRSIPNRFILSNRLFVGVGLISYPLYLWHWPLFVYAKFVFGYGFGILLAGQKLWVLCLSILLASMTYLAIEMPIRRQFSMKIAAVLAGSMFVIMVISSAVFLFDGLPRMRDERLNTVVMATYDRDFPGNLKRIVAGNLPRAFSYRSHLVSTTLFIGDSHAEQYFPRVSKVIDESMDRVNSVIFVGNQDDRCFAERIFTENDEDFCWGAIKDIRDLALKDTTDAVVLSYAGVRVKTLLASESGRKNLTKFARLLIQAGKRLYIVLINPEGSELSPRNMFVGSRLTGLSVTSSDQIVFNVTAFRENFGKAQDELRKLAVEVGAIAIDPFEVLCPNGTCPVLDEAGKPLYQDNNHLSASYARSSATYIDETLLPTARR